MLRACALSLAVFALCGVAFGGDLNPPPGAIAPTMKSLDQVEAWTAIDPRTAVGDEGAVVVITQSGRYKLVGDINGQPGKHGVRITAEDVVFDTNGFSLIGVPGSLDGISCENSTRAQIGPVRWMAPESIRGWGGNGVSFTGVVHASVRHVGISECGGDGVRAVVAPNGTPTTFRTRHVVAKEVLTGRAMHVSGYVECQCDHLIAADTGGGGVEIIGAAVVRLEDIDVGSAGGWGIDIDSRAATRAEVRVEKFNVKQEFGPTQGGVRARVGDGGGGGGRIVIRAGSIADTGLTGLVCGGYETATLSALNIGSSGQDGVSMRAGGGSGGSATDMDDIDVFGSVGDNVNFNPLATGGTHGISVSGGNFGHGGGHGLSVVPQSAGTYVFELSVRDSTASGNGGDGVHIEMDTDHRVHAQQKGMQTNSNLGHGVCVVANQNPVGSSSMSMTDCTSNGNGLDGTHVTWTQTGGPFVFTTKSGEMVGNTGRGAYKWWVNKKMKEATISGNGGHGLEMVGGTLDASDSSFSGNGSSGVHTDDTSCWIRVCQASDNSGHGFANVNSFGGKKGYDHYMNRASGNAAHGISVNDAEPTIVSCVLSGNGQNGVDMRSSEGGAIERCTANNNGGAGILVGTTCLNGSVVDNRCDNNTSMAISISGSGIFLARNAATAGPLGTIEVLSGNHLVGPTVDAGNIATEGSPNANMNR